MVFIAMIAGTKGGHALLTITNQAAAGSPCRLPSNLRLRCISHHLMSKLRNGHPGGVIVIAESFPLEI